MGNRSIIGWIAATILTMLVVPFLQTPATKLAEQIGFDKLLSDSWRPAMSWISQILTAPTQDPWYIFLTGCFFGIVAALWADIKLKSRHTSVEPPVIADSVYAFFQFFDLHTVPVERKSENILSWYALFTESIFVDTKDKDNISLGGFSVAAWVDNIFSV